MTYSTVLTYFLWLTAGWFGLHHFYLRRDRHAFVWLWTLGGGCGIGWLIEFFHLHRYVRASNMEEKYASGEHPFPVADTDPAQAKRPPFAIRRFIGELFFGYWIGTILMITVPEDIGKTYYQYLSSVAGPAGAALGIHTVANIGVEQCDLFLCLAFSYAALPFLLFLPQSYAIGTLTKGIILTSIAINYNPGSGDEDNEDQKSSLSYLRRAWSIRSKRYRRTKPVKRHLCRRLGILVGCSTLFVACILTALYFNAYITTDYGEQLQMRVAIDNLLRSPGWAKFWDTTFVVLDRLWYGGTEQFFEQLYTAFDPEGELHAYEVLNLTANATEKEINERYKKLVRQFHPDRFPNVYSEEKRKIEDRFIEIQQSYERISTIKMKRIMKNKRTEL